MPYFPPSVDYLPATRFIILCDYNHKVRVVDESEVLRQGVNSFTGVWETPTLNRQDPTKEYTLRKLMIFYQTVSNTTVSLYPTGDGGETYGTARTPALITTSGSRMKRAVAGFNTTGFDLRVRIDFDTNVVAVIHGYKATLIERSDILIS